MEPESPKWELRAFRWHSWAVTVDAVSSSGWPGLRFCFWGVCVKLLSNQINHSDCFLWAKLPAHYVAPWKNLSARYLKSSTVAYCSTGKELKLEMVIASKTNLFDLLSLPSQIIQTALALGLFSWQHLGIKTCETFLVGHGWWQSLSEAISRLDCSQIQLTPTMELRHSSLFMQPVKVHIHWIITTCPACPSKLVKWKKLFQVIIYCLF